MVIAGAVIHLLRDIIKIQREKNNLSELVECMKFDFTKVNELIDGIIDNAGILYKIEHPIVKNGNEVVTLSKDEIKDMMEFMMKEVLYHITPSVETMLKVIVNIDTEEDLMDFVLKKIKLYVLSYSHEVQKVTYE